MQANSNAASPNTEQQPLLSASSVVELRRLDFRARRQVDTQMAGAFRSAFKGSGLTFADFREYQPGDDVRSIHWKASARTGRTYVKDYEEERQCTFLLLLDVSRSTIFSGANSVRRQLNEFSALLALLARRNHDRLGLLLFDSQIRTFIKPLPATRLHYQTIIHAVLSCQSTDQTGQNTNLPLALNECLKLQKKRAVVMLLSDFHSDNFANELRLVSLKHELICLCCNHEQEYNLPDVGLVSFVDAESGRTLTIDSSSRYSKSALAKLQVKQQQELQKLVRGSGADFVQFKDSAIATLRQLIRTRKSRGRISNP